MVKVNTKDTGTLFEKSFVKYLFNYEKRLPCQIGSTKAFPFRYIHLFSKKLMTFPDFVSPKATVNNFVILFWGRIYLNNILHIQF